MRHFVFIFTLAFTLSQTACNPAQDIKRVVLETQIDAAEAHWEAQNITDYRLTVGQSSLWHGQDNTLRVRDHLIIEQSAVCHVTPLEFDRVCEVEEVDLRMYTVEGLFAHARRLVDQVPIEYLSIEFHPTYGFPERITVTPLHANDADAGWSVQEFEPLDCVSCEPSR